MRSSSTEISKWKHTHAFDAGNPLAERGTRRVVMLTAVAMVVEIVCGTLFNSMALLADGWHMGTHALALGLSALAYWYARRFAHDSRFAFGTWKIEVLAAYTSAVLLVVVAGLMAVESVTRLVHPADIRFDEAIAVAALGLGVNLLCAWILGSAHHHHGHGHHGHDHDHHHDLNLRSAYLHVVMDAATSVLAIVALLCGKLWGAQWLDPVMGIAGAGLITLWAASLLRDAARVLVDAEMDAPLAASIRETIRDGALDAHLCDLHLWRVGKHKYACIVSLVTGREVTADDIKARLRVHLELVHVTVEVNRLPAALSVPP